MERKTKFILLGILILIIIGASLWLYPKDTQVGSLSLDIQITNALRSLAMQDFAFAYSPEARTSTLVAGHPEINTLELRDVLPREDFNISEDEVIFVSADSCDDLIVSEKTLKAKKRYINVWTKGCGDTAKENPKYYIVLGNTQENIRRKCNDIQGIESKTCKEWGGIDVCLSNEICPTGLLPNAVDTDYCCRSTCEEYNMKSCADIGGKMCASIEECTEGVWVTDIIRDGKLVKDDVPPGAHVETRFINGTWVQDTYAKDGSVLEHKIVERPREERHGYCCTGQCVPKS